MQLDQLNIVAVETGATVNQVVTPVVIIYRDEQAAARFAANNQAGAGAGVVTSVPAANAPMYQESAAAAEGVQYYQQPVGGPTGYA